VIPGALLYPIDSRAMHGKSSIGAGWAIAIALVAITITILVYRYLRASRID
jgi:hypothetical protein